MKRLVIILLTLTSTISFSQTEKDSLKQDVINSIKAVNSSDYNTFLKYFPDFVFENITKEDLLKDISKGVTSHVSEDIQIKIDTIMTIDFTKYARFHFKDGIKTYGIKAKTNKNWTFIDLNEMTKKYIPIQIQAIEEKN